MTASETRTGVSGAVRDAGPVALGEDATGPADRATVLRHVADIIRADHGRCCDNHAVWAEIAGWLDCVAIDEQWGEPETAPRIRERTTALRVAEAYLTGQSHRTTTPADLEVS